MKRILTIILFILSMSYLNANSDINDIKILIKQNGEYIKQNAKYIQQNAEYIKQNAKLIQQNGTKISILESNAQRDKEQMSFIQNLIFIILAGVFGLPIYFNNKQKEEDRIVRDKVRDIITALKELAQDDPKIRRSLDVAGLL